MILYGKEGVQKKEGNTDRQSQETLRNGHLEGSTKSGEVAILSVKALPAILKVAKPGAWDSLDGARGLLILVIGEGLETTLHEEGVKE